MLLNSMYKAKNSMNAAGVQVRRPSAFMPFILVLVLAVFFLKGTIIKLYNKWKVNKANKDVLNGRVIIPDSTYPIPNNSTSNGSQSTKTINLNLIAQSIYDAVNNNDWLGFTEDEDEMIDQIKQVPKNLIPQLADEYAKISKKGLTLYQTYIKYIDKSELQKSGVWTLLN